MLNPLPVGGCQTRRRPMVTSLGFKIFIARRSTPSSVADCDQKRGGSRHCAHVAREIRTFRSANEAAPRAHSIRVTPTSLSDCGRVADDPPGALPASSQTGVWGSTEVEVHDAYDPSGLKAVNGRKRVMGSNPFQASPKDFWPSSVHFRG